MLCIRYPASYKHVGWVLNFLQPDQWLICLEILLFTYLGYSQRYIRTRKLHVTVWNITMCITASIDFSSFCLLTYTYVLVTPCTSQCVSIMNTVAVAGQLARTLRTTQQFSIYFAPWINTHNNSPTPPSIVFAQSIKFSNKIMRKVFELYND